MSAIGCIKIIYKIIYITKNNMGRLKEQMLTDQYFKDLIYEVENKDNTQGEEPDQQDGSVHCKD